MAGLPKDFAAGSVTLGAGTLWIGTAVPASGAIVVTAAAADGSITPDATANPSAAHLGYTAEGTRVLYKPEVTDFVANESTAPVISALTGEPSSITGTWWQILDFDIMLMMMPGGTAFAPSGFNAIKWGGKQTATTYPVTLIAPLYSDATKIYAFTLYKAMNVAGFEINISSKDVAASPFEFRGQSVGTRAAGDQIGAMWRTTP